MDKFRVRRTSSNHIGAINKTQYVNINMESTSNNLLHDNNVATLDLNGVFLSEREKCRNYRMMFTINPYCTNVLFNPCTEITYYDKENKLCNVDNKHSAECKDALGKQSGLIPYDMIRNTEYSSEKHGFDYHPGLDIFNNHIIRNKSYRIVNSPLETTNKDFFNTIEDYLRLEDGSVLKKCCRLDVTDTETSNKHLYNYDDILEFGNGDAINENLREDNGWFGFYNTSTIDAKDKDGKSLDISRVINNKGNCEFIDMYPGRKEFSFSPQYNNHKKRVEYNWDFVLTYPYEHTTQRQIEDKVEDIHVIQSGGRNGLFIVDAKMINTPSGGIGIQFRTLTRHNLKKGDIIHLYFNENKNNDTIDDVWREIGIDIIVYGLGDQYGNNKDYYFYINNLNLLDKVFANPKENEQYTEWDYIRDYFYKEITDSDVIENLGLENNAIIYPETGLCHFPSNYDKYIVIIDKENNKKYYSLYNKVTGKFIYNEGDDTDYNGFIMRCVNNAFRINDSEYPAENTSGYWDDYITFRVVKVDNNVECEYYVRKFKKLPVDYRNEIYKLAFANTIYGDDLSQITFTDTINVDNLRDNRGRELTDIYLTIIKANRGNEEWYLGDNNYNSDLVECSHCFGHVISGFDYFSTTIDDIDIRNKRKDDYDIRYVINDMSPEGKKRNLNSDYITSKDDWFYGDIVEYSPSKCVETILCDVNFRFNTMQRESGVIGPDGYVDKYKYTFKYDDIISDDYDRDGFEIETTSLNGIVKNEGYYYKPHYRIRLRGFSELKQDNHRALFISDATPYQMNGMYIKLSTKIKHNLLQGSKVILTDKINDHEWILDVVYVINNYTFVINKVDKTDEHYHDWVTICTCINNGDFTVKALNENIPQFASKIDGGTYLWRDTVGLWDAEEPVEYPYANNALYIDETFNFYLKRQNSDRSINEYKVDDIINDIKGEKSDIEPNYAYKDENENRC